MGHDFETAVYEGTEPDTLVVTGDYRCKQCRLKISLPAAWSRSEQIEYLEGHDFGRACDEPGGSSDQ